MTVHEPCPPCPIEDNGMFTLLNVCRILFYTPIIFLSGLIGSVAYDYVTFKKEDENNEKNKDKDEENEDKDEDKETNKKSE